MILALGAVAFDLFYLNHLVKVDDLKKLFESDDKNFEDKIFVVDASTIKNAE